MRQSYWCRSRPRSWSGSVLSWCLGVEVDLTGSFEVEEFFIDSAGSNFFEAGRDGFSDPTTGNFLSVAEEVARDLDGDFAE